MSYNKYIKYKTKYKNLSGGGKVTIFNTILEGNLYYSEKVLEYKTTTYEIERDKVYFYFEKIKHDSGSNYNKWSQYYIRENYDDIKEGEIGFSSMLHDHRANYSENRYNPKQETFDLWIGYASRLEQTPQNPLTFTDIEMCVTVSCNKDSLTTTHMGIFRTGLFFSAKNNPRNPHKNLAMELHKFCFFATQQIYDTKKYMITSPVTLMRKIMSKYFITNNNNPDGYWVGEYYEKLKHNTHIKNNKHDFDLIQKNDFTIDKYKSFGENIKNKIKDVIKLFDLVLKDNSQLNIGTNKNTILSELKINKDASDSTIIEKIIEMKDSYHINLIKRQVEQKDSDTRSMQRLKEFYPLDDNSLPPVGIDKDKNIMLYNNTELQLPPWYKNEHLVSGRISTSTIIVSIEEYINGW